jgi:hypothetical protein
MEDRLSGLEDKVGIMGKSDEDWKKEWRNKTGTCKNSGTPLRHRTYESWPSKKEKFKLNA